MDSEMSTCSCFLLRQLLLAQKTAHARGPVREPRAMVIGTCLRNVGGTFFKQFCGAFFFSLKIVIVDENRLQNGPNMRFVGSYFLAKVQN